MGTSAEAHQEATFAKHEDRHPYLRSLHAGQLTPSRSGPSTAGGTPPPTGVLTGRRPPGTAIFDALTPVHAVADTCRQHVCNNSDVNAHIEESREAS